MEYQRKFRWANYETPKCKEYLRNDFSHECAYCKLQEKEVGLIDANYFEGEELTQVGASSEKVQRMFNWKAQKTIEQMIEDEWMFYQKQLNA